MASDKPILLPQIVSCGSGTVRNSALQPSTDPILQVTLQTQDGRIYLLPLSEKGCAQLWEVISNWRRARDFLSEQESPEPSKLQ